MRGSSGPESFLRFLRCDTFSLVWRPSQTLKGLYSRLQQKAKKKKKEKKENPARSFLMHVLCFCKSVAIKASSLLPIETQEISEVQSLPIARRGLPVLAKDW